MHINLCLCSSLLLQSLQPPNKLSLNASTSDHRRYFRSLWTIASASYCEEFPSPLSPNFSYTCVQENLQRPKALSKSCKNLNFVCQERSFRALYNVGSCAGERVSFRSHWVATVINHDAHSYVLHHSGTATWAQNLRIDARARHQILFFSHISVYIHFLLHNVENSKIQTAMLFSFWTMKQMSWCIWMPVF